MATLRTATRACTFAGQHLGLRVGANEASCVLDPSAYTYGTPSPAQQEALRQQLAQLGVPGFSSPAGGAAAFGSGLPMSASVLAGGAGGQKTADELLDSMLPLDLDDDCLRLMFGEEEGDESSKAGGASSGAQGGDRAAVRSSAAAKAEPALPEEEDAVDLLFQDLSSLRHVSSYGSLDLDMLTALQQDFDTASSGEAAAGEGEEAEAAAGGQKRARKEAGGRPPLMLSMNYASAAQTINSLIAAECKVGCAPSDSLADPGSPGSALSDGTQEQLERSNSCGKRKRF